MLGEIAHKSHEWQICANQLPRQQWDTVIIGAGPAGSAAAIRLAQRGYAVLLLEKFRIPREKVCGDVLLPDALARLDELSLGETVRSLGYPISAMTIFSPGGISFDVNGDFITLERAKLDALIARRAFETGVTVCRATVNQIRHTNNGHVEVLLQSNPEPITARFAIIATGAQVNLAEKTDLVAVTHPTALAMRCYVQSPVRLDKPILSYDKSIRPGYAWVFPLGNGKYNVGCGTLLKKQTARGGAMLREVYQTFVSQFPAAREIVAAGTQISPLKGAALKCSLPEADRAADDHCLAAGETIGTTLPFTGEGIGTAMSSAFLAADVIDRALKTDGILDGDSYRRLLDEQLRPVYAGYKIAQRYLAIPWINDLVARRIQKNAFLREACRGIILGTVNPKTVYSVRGILKSFLS